MRKFRIVDTDTNETVDDVAVEWIANQVCADWNDAESASRNRYKVVPYEYRGPDLRGGIPGCPALGI